jgi:hypothetical protein
MADEIQQTGQEELPVIEPRTGPPCRHLRNKGMYVYTDDFASGAYNGSDSSIYWCLRSMTAFGPDDDLVDGQECRNPDRSCYEPM